jgi:spermidine/putrescine transport system substrate-binding protein
MKASKPRFRPTRRSFLSSTGALAVGLTLLPRRTPVAGGAAAQFLQLGHLYRRDHARGLPRRHRHRLSRWTFMPTTTSCSPSSRAGNPGYDVIVPTNDYVERMIEANMVMPLDHSKIPNMDNIEAPFRDAAFDPGRKHSMPYMWGTMGIGYRKSRVEEPVDSWKVRSWKGRSIPGASRFWAMPRTCSAARSSISAISFNSTNPDEIKTGRGAADRQQAPHQGLRRRHRTGPADRRRSGAVPGVERRHQAGDGRRRRPGLCGAEEGTLLWQDCLAIPKGARIPTTPTPSSTSCSMPRSARRSPRHPVRHRQQGRQGTDGRGLQVQSR